MIYPPIVSPFTHGDTVTITIIDLSDNSIVVNAVACVEIGVTGYYKYTPSLVQDTKTYIFIMTNGNTAFDCVGELSMNILGDLRIDNILADTNELQTDLTNGGRLDLLIDAIKTKTDLLKNSWNDLSAASVNAEVDSALNDYDGPTKTEMDTALDLLPIATEIRQEIDDHSTQLANIVEDTNEIQVDLKNTGRIDELIDSIIADLTLIHNHINTIDGHITADYGSTQKNIIDELKNTDLTEVLSSLSDIYSEVQSIQSFGKGSKEVTYTLTKIDLTPIADANVKVTSDILGLYSIAEGRTNQLGQITLQLDPGSTVYLWRSKTGEVFINPDIEIVPT